MKHCSKGITIVELLIYLGLSTILLLILSQFFVSILDESFATQNYSAVQDDGRYIMARLRYQISSADSITLPVNLGETSTSLQLATGGITYNYFVRDEKFYYSVGTTEALMSSLDSKVTDVSFTKLGNVGGKPVVNIAFTISAGIEGTAQYESQTYKGAGGLR
jgi:hypothetical protein